MGTRQSIMQYMNQNLQEGSKANFDFKHDIELKQVWEDLTHCSVVELHCETRLIFISKKNVKLSRLDDFLHSL